MNDKEQQAKELAEKIDDILCRPFDGDFTRIRGQMRWRLSLAERITLREQIISAVKNISGCCLPIEAGYTHIPELTLISDEEIKNAVDGADYDVVIRGGIPLPDMQKEIDKIKGRAVAQAQLAHTLKELEREK